MSLLGEALAWWATQMAALVPAGWRPRDRDHGEALMVNVAVDATGPIGLSLRQAGRETPLGRIAPGTPVGALQTMLAGRRPRATLLRLPADRLLERVVTLPLAAERELSRVLAYEFDRFTPFAAADVYWSWTILRHDRARRELRVRLSMVPKAGLATIVALLEASGQPPTGLRVAAEGEPRRIGLAAEERGAGRAGRWAVRTTAALCVVLALVAGGLPIVLPLRALARIDAEIERLRPQLAEVEALRRRIANRTGGEDVLATEAARLGSALAAIATLTDILPDDTHLIALTLRQRRVTLNGQSGDAARLIPRLSADPTVRDVSFLAPVTRVDASRAELFSLRLDLGG